MQKYVVVDVETTGQSVPKGDRMIEIAIVVIENDQITQQYMQLINPEKPIPAFISQLTSIEDQDVVDQPIFEDIIETVEPLLEGAVFVAHNAPFDLSFLNGELIRAGKQKRTPYVIDTVELARILLPQAPSYKLNELAEYLQITHNNPHRALSDALVTADLLLLLKNKFQHLPQNVIQQILSLSSGFRSDWQIIHQEIDQYADRSDMETYRGFSMKKMAQTTPKEQVITEDFAAFAEDCYRYLAETNSDYEERPGQAEISNIVFDHFRMNQHALIEAETGLGKTIAYLIPMIYEALSFHHRVVVSTNNTNLQSQLLEQDMKKLGIPVRAAIIKGKNHYLSLQNFEQFYQDKSRSSYQDRMFKAMILVWLTETSTGDIDELQFSLHKQPALYQLVSQHQRLQPAWQGYCFYERTLAQADQASVIITNHALLAIDMLSEYDILPSYQKLVVDEAHQLEEVAANYLGASVSYVEITAFFHPLEKQTLQDIWLSESIETCKYELDLFFRQLFQYVQAKNKQGRMVSDIGRLKAVWDNQARIDYQDATKRVMLLLDQLVPFFDEETQQQLTAYKEVIRQLLLQETNESITWLEIDPQGAENAVYIQQEPFSVQEELQDYLFSQKESVILISATLTMNRSFSYMKAKLGLISSQVKEYVMDPYFDYKRNVQLLIPNNLPAFQYPKNEAFLYAINEAIVSIAVQSKGRLLVLFTSYDMLKKSYYILKEVEELQDYLLLGQGLTTGSRNRLIKQFQGFDQSILLGTNAYWQGVDIPGDDLSCLVIVKLPFQSPQDPIFQAKSAYLKSRGKNPFRELSLPQAVLQFKQGFGRLIRKHTDKGSVLVFDDRLITKRYGQSFIDSVPDIPVFYEPIEELIERISREG
ncbi:MULTISPECIES: ATP-dependent DNA helicase DinG [Gracilibacillus]|uniref:ATP-dependent DNA helicase DinG n=1 Tax=Gracilibacillus TaxID=74385 RepID=UPI000825F306|nr:MULTISPECIES: ATP-dependent DNA helicase DinG [Gracilibacillus]